MLPSDNVYLMGALEANAVYQANGWPVRVAAVRMVEPAELEVALVVPTDGPGTLGAALERLPGHEPVYEVLAAKTRVFGHEMHALYFAEDQWPQVSRSPQWAYQG